MNYVKVDKYFPKEAICSKNGFIPLEVNCYKKRKLQE